MSPFNSGWKHQKKCNWCFQWDQKGTLERNKIKPMQQRYICKCIYRKWPKKCLECLFKNKNFQVGTCLDWVLHQTWALIKIMKKIKAKKKCQANRFSIQVSTISTSIRCCIFGFCFDYTLKCIIVLFDNII